MIRQNVVHNLEQLWAIQSTENGAAPVIIATTKYFSDHRDLIGQMKRYLPYALPLGCNPQTMRKDDAPINLSFFIIEQNGQRVLLYKSYVVQATDEQPGIYFIHMLTNLPAGFSAKHAIVLWRSPFWQQTIKKWASLDFSRTQGTIAQLEPISIDKLDLKQRPNFPDVNIKKINRYLSYIIQAHLLQQKMLQDKQKIPHLYIAATPDEVAYLLYMLLHLLPKQLTRHVVTFSTYEQNIANNAPCLFIGTYAPLIAILANETSDIIPKQYYTKEFALNHTTGDISRLPTIPSWPPAYYARYSTRCYINKDMRELNTFLTRLETLPELDFASFSNKYEEFLRESDHPLFTLEQFLAQPDSTIIHKLANDKNTRAGLIDCALIERGQFLAQFTQRLRLMSQSGKQRDFVPFENDISNALLQAGETNNPDFFLATLSLLESLSISSPTWISLLSILTRETQIIEHNWEVRAKLLQILHKELSPQERQEHFKIIEQLLYNIRPQDISQLLSLSIPLNWLFMADIAGDGTTILNMQDRLALEKLLSEYGGNAIRDREYTYTTISLFKYVIYNVCTNKLPLMFRLLDHPSDQPVTKETLEEVYKIANLSSEEHKFFLGHYNIAGQQPAYIALYPDAISWQQPPFMPQAVQAPLSPQPQEMHQPARTQENRDDFLTHLTFTADTMWKLADVISNHPTGTYTHFVQSVAQALVDCIEDTFQLSIAISTIATVCGNDYSHYLLQEMLTLVNTIYRQIIQTASEPSPEFQRGKLLLAAYTHYTFEFSLFFYKNDQNIILALLHILLQDIDTETFKFLNEASVTWSLATQSHWQKLESQLHPLPIQLPSTSEVNYKKFISPELQNVYTDEKEQAFQSLQAVWSKKGAKPLALAWLQHRMTLIQHMHGFQPADWQRIQTTSAFYVACQKADASQTPDLAAERAIIDAASHLQPDNLTKSENKRVNKAKTYFKQMGRNSLPSSATQASQSSQLPKQPGQERTQWVQKQPKATKSSFFWRRK